MRRCANACLGIRRGANNPSPLERGWGEAKSYLNIEKGAEKSAPFFVY